jgi:hypothetical protein
MVPQSVTNPVEIRATRCQLRGRFTDKGKPEVIPGRKAKALDE